MLLLYRCWGLRFTPSDHDFLHQSHVFSNISKILSRSEEVLGAGEEGVASMYESHGPVSPQGKILGSELMILVGRFPSLMAVIYFIYLI